MSRTRWDRNRPARQQRWDSDYTPLTGGLDQQAAALGIKPGRMAQCVNFEEVFGSQGYSFIKGYERFDGRSRPSRADYAIQAFADGVVAVSPGDVITDGTNTLGVAVSQTITSGSIADGDAAGHLLIVNPQQQLDSGATLMVGGSPVATASDGTLLGSKGYPDHQNAMRSAREYLRGLIEKVPGSGPVRGVAVFNGNVYAVRDSEDGTYAEMWYSTSNGWTTVQVGVKLHPGTTYRMEVANFTGATNQQGLFGVSGRGRLFRLSTNHSFLYADPIFGSEATSTTSLAVGTGSKVFTVAQTNRSWVNGDEVTAWKAYDASVFMRGIVTSYNSGTGALTVNVTEVGGSGTVANWEIGFTDYSDKPYLLRAHKNHMFLAYPQGQLQTSNVGDPLVFTTTATLFGVGQELVGMESLKGKALGIFCTGRIKVLEGSSQTDWDLGDYTTSSGAILGSIQENDGNPVFLNSRGLTCLQATQSFGDFESAIFSRDVKKTLDAKTNSVIGSRMAFGNYQYRLYFADGACLRFTFVTGNAVITPRDVSPSISEYNHIPTCFGSGDIDSEGRMFFGTDDGYVMEEDSGTSFDGEPIDYVLRLPYNHFKSPAIDKQFHKMELELECENEVDINYRQFFDYDDGTFQFGSGEFSTPGRGGQFNVDAFNTFAFNLPTINRAEGSIDGQGRNMGLLMWARSDFVPPATLQGILTFFTKLGVRP